MTHLAHGARAVIGLALDNHRGTARTVALVTDFFVARALEFAGTALDRAFDGVLGHVGVERLVHHRAQTRIELGVAASTRSDGDLTDNLGEELAALGVLCALVPADVGPFGMAGRELPPPCVLAGYFIRFLPERGAQWANRPVRRNWQVWSTTTRDHSIPKCDTRSVHASAACAKPDSATVTTPSCGRGNLAMTAPRPWGKSPLSAPMARTGGCQRAGSPANNSAMDAPSIHRPNAKRARLTAARLPWCGEPQVTTRPGRCAGK